MFEICRACLKSFNIFTKPYYQFNNNSLSETERLMFSTVIPEMDLDIPRQLFFCDTCNISLQNAYEFKKQCCKTEETIQKYFNTVKTINIEDFDLKAVAFKFSDLTEEDTIVEEVENSVYKKMLTEDTKQSGNKNNLYEEVKIKSGEDIENLTIVEHDVKNFYSCNEKEIESRTYSIQPSDFNKHEHDAKNFYYCNEKEIESRNNSIQPSDCNSIKNCHVHSHSEKDNSSLECGTRHKNTFQNSYNPQKPYSGINNQAFQNNYIIINNTNMSQINSMFQNLSNDQTFQNNQSSNQVDVNFNKYANMNERNMFSENSHSYNKIDKNKCGCLGNKLLTNNNLSLCNNLEQMYKKRKLIDDNTQQNILNVTRQNISKSNTVGLLKKKTEILEKNISKLKSNEIIQQKCCKFNTEKTFKTKAMQCKSSTEGLLKKKSEVTNKNAIKRTFLIEDIISDKKLEKKSLPIINVTSDILFVDVLKTKSELVETKIETKVSEISTEVIKTIDEKNKLQTDFTEEHKKGLDNFPIYKDIIDPKSYDSSKKQVKRESLRSEEKSAEVIPHLKKFYVCHICGKLLSTRFYAFHMKTHQ